MRKRALIGVHVTVTGKLPVPRDEAKRYIEANGGVWQSAVTRSTDILVEGDTGRYDEMAKIAAAKEFGVVFCSWQELRNRVLAFERGGGFVAKQAAPGGRFVRQNRRRARQEEERAMKELEKVVKDTDTGALDL